MNTPAHAAVPVLRSLQRRLLVELGPNTVSDETKALQSAIAALGAQGEEVKPVPKRAPVQGYHGKNIPWEVHGLAWEAYAKKYRGQSAERIAERGGFGVSEMDTLLPDWRKRVAEHALPAARAIPAGWRDDVNALIQYGTCHEMSSQTQLHCYVEARDRLLNLIAAAPPVAEEE